MRHWSRRTSLTFHFLAPGDTQRYYLSSQQGFDCGFVSTCTTTQRNTVLGKNWAPQSLNRTPPCLPPEWFTHTRLCLYFYTLIYSLSFHIYFSQIDVFDMLCLIEFQVKPQILIMCYAIIRVSCVVSHTHYAKNEYNI